MVSIKDVARVAGVSDKTVSRVVNREANVHRETQKKVEQAIARLKYVPNLGARQVRTNRSNTIGVMTDLVTTTPYSGDIVRGIYDWAHQIGRTVLISNTGGDKEEEARGWRVFQEHRIDGVIYATMWHREVELNRAALPLPTVLVNCFSAVDPEFPAVIPDDYHGSVRLTEHLVSLGHRRIGYVRLNPTLLAARLRLEGFHDTMRQHGVPVDESLLVEGMFGEVGHDSNVAFESTLELLARHPRPTAIMCGNDEIAMPVYCAVLASKLRIPDDISIVGFDDFQTVAHGLRPDLTTAALPYHALGRDAARRLEAVLFGQKPEIGVHKADCALVNRHSTGPARS